MKNLMNNLIEFLMTLAGIKLASFVGVKNYFISNTVKGTKCIESGYKDMLININVNRKTLKRKDRENLSLLNRKFFYNSYVNAINPKFTFELFNKAVDNLFNQCTIVGQKLADGTTKEVKTNRQKSHEITYTHITNGIKYHAEFNELYLSGVFKSSKKSDGLPLPIYKTTNKRPQTLIQDILKDELNLTSFKYRTLILKNAGIINTSKLKFDGKELTIDLK